MLTLIGLGPANTSAGLSFGAWDMLASTPGLIFTRAGSHAALARLEAAGIQCGVALDDSSDADAVERVLKAARAGDALYAVPGHPLLGDSTCIPLVEALRREEIPLRVFAPAPLPADTPADFDALAEVMARLRGPEGCPWDREQTPLSLRKYAIEEAYEVVEAVDSGSPAKLSEELGDLLLQVVFHAQIASETGAFTLRDVSRHIVEKLVRRHPHVFGTVTVSGSDEVLTNWQRIKRSEPGYEDRVSILDGIPVGLPALMRAAEVSKRVVKAGFEWPNTSEVLDKVEEEIAELRAEIASGQTERAGDELGDLLFTLVNVARCLGVDSEDALRRMTLRFAARFKHIERHAAGTGRAVSDLTLAEMEAVWQQAKREE